MKTCRKLSAAAGAALALNLAASGAAALPRERPDPVADQWIVELSDSAVSTYYGGTRGLAATAPRANAKLAPDSTTVREYVRHVDARADAALAAAAPAVGADARYRYALTGFAARLTSAQADAMRRQPGVRRVTRETFFAPRAAAGGIGGSEPALLGLPGGLWKRLGGAANAGKGVIVGVIDSGITQESASFRDPGLDPPAVWYGACEAGEQFPVTSCNNKLVGARWFLDGLLPDPGNLPPGTVHSPRDDDGHGTHVAAAAVGDRGVDPVIGTNTLGVDRLSGIAPASHLAVYKACTQGLCSSVDVISAVDAAVADGVDVLNLSLGRPADPASPIDPLQRALLNADAAGVFVAAPAGNAGTAENAIDSPAVAPWTTAVAATTGARTFRTTLSVTAAGGQMTVTGSSVAGALAPAPLVDAARLGPPADFPPDDPRYCAEALTPAKVAGKVVLCEAFAPTDVIESNVRDAGGAGLMIVVPDSAEEPAEAGVIPTVFLRRRDADAVRRVLAGAEGTVSFPTATATTWEADRIAAFSSRGPSPAVPEVLRPDVAAPGVAVLAAFPPVTWLTQGGGVPQERFAVLSGTSMATPQVAGVAALLTQLHPTWSSAALRSALVTSATGAQDGDGPASHVAEGGGRVDPQAAADAELVVAPTTDEYRRYAAGLEPGSGDDPIAPRDLNLPSISLDQIGEPVKVQRTVTNVSPARGEWEASIEGVDVYGLDGRVSPRRFTLAPGQQQTVTIELSAYNGTPDFRSGAILLHNLADGADTRMPLAIRDPGVFDPPSTLALDATQPDGERDLPLRIAGRVHAVGYGLSAPDVEKGVLADRAEVEGLLYSYDKPVHVEAGTNLLSAQAGWPDSVQAATVSIYRDIDHDGRYSIADELVSGDQDPRRADVSFPAAGDYLIDVVGVSDAPFRFDLRTWRVSDPVPDDPTPGPGLVVEGDTYQWPAGEHTFNVRWNAVTGQESLRGVIAWVNDDDPQHERRLAATVVDTGPEPSPARPLTREQADQLRRK